MNLKRAILRLCGKILFMEGAILPNAEQVIEQIKQIDNNQELNKIKEIVESIDNNLKEIILSELSDKTFKIPYYQRGYRWTENNINTLLDDFKEFLDDKSEGNIRYILQPLAIAKTKNENEFEVIDGQQRLTTLYLIHKYLVKNLKKTSSSWYSFNYDFESTDENKGTKLSQILSHDISPYSANDTGIDEKNINVFYVRQAYTAINNWFDDKDNSSYKEKIYELFIEKNTDKKAILFLWYEVQDKMKASVFQNINSNKIQLTNDDLIKALFLSKTTGLPNREQIAVQYEIMERQFNLDKFWFMFNNKDINRSKGQARIDFLFNIYKQPKDQDKVNRGLVSIEEYQNDSRTAFYKIMKLYNKDKSILERIWKSVRKNYQILMEFYNNPEYYHYIGFLRYATKDNTSFRNKLLELLSEYVKCTKRDITVRTDTDNDFVNTWLKIPIKKIINKDSLCKLEDIDYGDKNREKLRLIFVLHNIETILCDYKKFRKKIGISTAIEYFPFEIFYKQNWQIEHIASSSTNTLDDPSERLESLISYLDVFKKFNNCPYKTNAYNYDFENPELNSEYIQDKNIFNSVFETIKNDVEKIGSNLMPMEYTPQWEKNSIKNLVLLDSKTNQEYHNATLPNKREKILDLLRNETLEDNDIRYIPICTRSVFMKAYNNKSRDFAYWTREDAKLYLSDMKTKLAFYFDKEKENL